MYLTNEYLGNSVVWQLSSHFYYKNLAQIFPTKLSKLGAISGGIMHPLSGFIVGKFWWWLCAVTNMTVTVIRKESPAVTHNHRSKPQLSLSFTLTVFLIQHFPSLGLRIEPTASHGWNEDQSIVIAPGHRYPGTTLVYTSMHTDIREDKTPGIVGLSSAHLRYKVEK